MNTNSFQNSGTILINEEDLLRLIERNKSVSIVGVIFNEPATIVFWNDGSKTVVKAQNGEKFDPEKGLAMAILKRIRGNLGCYNNEFKKWLSNYHQKGNGSNEEK